MAGPASSEVVRAAIVVVVRLVKLDVQQVPAKLQQVLCLHPSHRVGGAEIVHREMKREVSGITRYQSGAFLTVIGNTSIGNRRANYVGGPVLLPNPGPNGWINPAAFAPAPDTSRGNSGVGIVTGPNLQLWDFSMRKEFSITEKVKLRFQADMFNAFNRANFKNPDVSYGTLVNGLPSNTGFGTISSTGPARNIQFGLKLNF